MAKIRVLAPAYFKDFMCIGTDCEDNCCKTWGINIDKATYQKYKKLNKSQFNPLKDKAIVLNKENRNSTDYARIRFRENGYCPFLTEHRLCAIYQKLGTDYMANICKSYPRIIRYVDRQMEISLLMSCPEAVRKALLSKKIMEFEYLDIEYQAYMNNIGSTVYTTGEALQKEEHRYFWDIRMAAIDILQNRRFSIVERLMLLGMMYKRVQKCVDEKNYDMIPKEISDFVNVLNQIDVDEVFSNLVGNPAIQLFALKVMIDNRILSDIGATGTLLNFMMMPRVALFSKNQDEAVDQFALDNFLRYLQEGVIPALKEYSYIIENYLVNLYFSFCMPFSSRFETMWDSLLYLGVMYSMIKVAMIGTFFEKESKITQENMISCVYRIAREFEHNPYYSKMMKIIAEELDLNTLGGLYILIHD